VLLAEKVMSVGFLTTANVLLSFEVQWIHRTNFISFAYEQSPLALRPGGVAVQHTP
jgi:hypothetical protein